MPSFASHHGRSLLHGHGDLSFCKKTKMIGTSLGSCFVEVNFCMFYFFLYSTESYCFSHFRVFYSSSRLSSFSNLVSCNWVVRVGVWHSQTPCRLHRPPPWPSKSLDLPTRVLGLRSKSTCVFHILAKTGATTLIMTILESWT